MTNDIYTSIKKVCEYIIKRNNDIPEGLDDYTLETYYEKYRFDCKDAFVVNINENKIYVDNLMKVKEAEYVLKNLKNVRVE